MFFQHYFLGHWSCSFPIVLHGLGHVFHLLLFMALVMFFCCCFELSFIAIICGLGCVLILRASLWPWLCSSYANLFVVFGCVFFC